VQIRSLERATRAISVEREHRRLGARCQEGDSDAPRPLRDPRPFRTSRLSPLSRRHDLRRRLGVGLEREGLGGDPRSLPGPGRKFHRYRKRVHEGPLREDYRRPRRSSPGQARPDRPRHGILEQPVPWRSERRRRQSQGDRGPVRAIVAAPADRLHRSLLDALVGRDDAHRRDHARARRSRHERQGAVYRLLGHARVEMRRGADHRGVSRMGAAHCAADRVLATPAHGRGRARAHGARTRAGRDSVVAAEERRPVGQVQARSARQARGRTGSVGDERARRQGVRSHRRAQSRRRRALDDRVARGHRVGARAPGRDVDHHRRPDDGATRRQSRCGRRDAAASR
jgi:hypothetical protein